MERLKNQRVLVTGAAGAIGRRVCAELSARGHAVVGFDLIGREAIGDPAAAAMVTGAAAWHAGELADAGAVRRACEGVDAVIHLGGEPHAWSDFMGKILPSNIVGTFNVLEAAKSAGVKRVVFASTCQVGSLRIGARENEPLASPLHPVADGVKPANLYAASKVFGEAACQAYALELPAVTFFAVRIAWMPRTAEECDWMSKARFATDSYLSPRDAGRFFACSVEAPEPARAEDRFVVMFATSRATPPRYELETARRVIGYEPVDEWPSGTELLGYAPPAA